MLELFIKFLRRLHDKEREIIDEICRIFMEDDDLYLHERVGQSQTSQFAPQKNFFDLKFSDILVI